MVAAAIGEGGVSTMSGAREAGFGGLTGEARELLAYLEGLTIIDAHEHTKPEAWHLAKTPDFSWLLLYAMNDLVSAGMARFDIYADDCAAEEKWARVKPYWPLVRHGSYARIARLSAEMLVGVSDLTDESVPAITAAMRADNKPGLYRRYFRERYHVERVVVSNGTLPVEPYPYSDEDLALLSLIVGVVSPRSMAELAVFEKGVGAELRTPEAYAKGMSDFVARYATAPGVVGFKAMSQQLSDDLSTAEVERALRAMARGEVLERRSQMCLNRFHYEETFRAVRDTGLPVGVHCGVWGDYRASDVENFIGIIPRFPEIDFDLYHMSVPSTRQTALVVRNLCNAYGNLCWAPTVSQALFESALEEWLDIVPVNKVIGFGGDIIFGPQAIFGCKRMSDESLARVFGGRVAAGRMAMAEACEVLGRWLYENPRQLYGLPPGR